MPNCASISSKVCFSLLFLVLPCFAEDPIDLSLKACLDAVSGQTTAGMISCTSDAADAWDKELNLVYQKIQQQLNDDSKAAFTESQRACLRHRDAELKFIDKLYSNKQGSMFTPMRAMDRLQIIKSRVIQLRQISHKVSL